MGLLRKGARWSIPHITNLVRTLAATPPCHYYCTITTTTNNNNNRWDHKRVKACADLMQLALEAMKPLLEQGQEDGAPAAKGRDPIGEMVELAATRVLNFRRRFGFMKVCERRNLTFSP